MKLSEIEGLTTVPSDFGSDETMNRLEKEIRSHGMMVFARINHAALAVESGLKLHPTEVIIFGNPRAGTSLMQAVQTIGIDLPLKMLIWRDVAGKTWVSYNKPGWLVKRHDITRADRTVSMMDLALNTIAAKAISFRAAKSFEALEGKSI
jgi:uncharacterized protein (DUF302 family)